MQPGNPAEAPLNPGVVFDMVNAHQRTAALMAACWSAAEAPLTRTREVEKEMPTRSGVTAVPASG